jgi:hypothetical protein
MRLLLALALAFFAAAPAAAQNQSLSGIPGAVTHDGLTIALVHTDNLELFNRGWAAGSRMLPVTARAVRGVALHSVILFQGCGAGPDGKCNVTAHFTYLKPDGSNGGDLDGTLWTDVPAPDGYTMLAPTGPAITMEPSDPMGTWTVRVRVTDTIRHVSVDTEAQIVVDTPATPAAVPAS